jgi:hypothetical protein
LSETKSLSETPFINEFVDIFFQLISDPDKMMKELSPDIQAYYGDIENVQLKDIFYGRFGSDKTESKTLKVAADFGITYNLFY